MDSLNSLDELVHFARVAEQAERYDDMAKCMKKVAEMGTKLDQEKRNLLSVAYKNVVGARRSSWRMITMIEQKAETGKRRECTSEFRKNLESELDSTCREVLELLDSHLVPSAVEDEEKVFYLKMKGDYWRYMAEYKDGEEGTCREDAIKNADEAYQKAMKVAKDKMPPIHPNRLGLALNYSVFHYEIRNNPEVACNLARDAFKFAMEDLDGTQCEVCKDTTLILQLLRDNLALWTSEAENGGEDQD